MGDMPDFENMTLEEQMRWLESLAARQGANPQEFMTTADMSVPEIDPNSVVIDEPGYVPSEKFSRPLSAAAGPSRPVEEPPQATEPIVPPVEAPAYDYSYAEQPTMMDYQFQEPPPIEPVAAVDPNDPLGGMDPMAWLESLAARQGANPNEFMTAANYEIAEIDPNSVVIDEPGYVPSEKFSRPLSAAAGPSHPVEEPPTVDTSATQPYEVAAEQPVPEFSFETPAVWAPQDGEIPVDADPMAWLESLAARQGADPAEFMTAANYEIPEIDPGSVVIDEPGYVPYSPFETTSGQPSSFASTESYQPAVPSMPLPESGLEPSEDTSSLSWLSDLAGDQEAGVPDFLSSFAADDIPGFDLSYDATPEPAPATPHMITSIEGMTDEEIAEAQAHGRITPEAELAWLMKKAEALAALSSLNDEFEATHTPEGDEIAPGQVPDWLAAQMPTDLGAAPVVEDTFPALIDEILPPPAPTDLPDWLSDSPLIQGSPEIELPEFTLEDTTAFAPMQDEILAASDFVAGYAQSGDDWAAALDEEFAMQHQSVPTSTEPEWYAEAVSKVEEGLPEPVQPEAYPQFDASMLEMPVETEIVPAETIDLPDWLQEMSSQVAPADSDLPEWLISSPVVEPEAISEVAIPEWLSESVVDPLSFVAENAPSEAGAFDYSQWTPEPTGSQPEVAFLAEASSEAEERLPAAQEGGLPSWYQVPVTETPPAPVYVAPAQPVVTPPPPPVMTPPPMAAPVQPRPAPVASPAASSRQVAQPVPPPSTPAPVPAGFAQYQATLEQNPLDHNTRLSLARELEKVGNLGGSLEHYETLVESSAALEIVADDLSKLSTRQPQHPRVRRLLGDTYMRQGRLQEALDAYRGALNQL